MSWDDVEDILFDGTPEQIDLVKCPECGGELRISFFPTTRNIEIICKKCHTVVRSHGAEKTPNFAVVKA
jgi:ssDNA-binding Zn-finger/Zn-ribbon topoisomerase 1